MGKFIVIILSIVLMAGCSKSPSVEIQAADSALETLLVAGGEEYAQELTIEAKNSNSLLKAEISAQEEKFSLFRSYKNTKVLALEAKVIADSALATTEENKILAKNEATKIIETATASLAEAKALILIAPRGKGSELDIEILSSDISTAESVLLEAETQLSAGAFKDAQVTGQKALSTLSTVLSDLNSAINSGK